MPPVSAAPWKSAWVFHADVQSSLLIVLPISVLDGLLMSMKPELHESWTHAGVKTSSQTSLINDKKLINPPKSDSPPQGRSGLLDNVQQLLGFSKMSYTQTSRVGIADETVLAGTSHVFTDFISAGPAALAIHPAAGATATVSITCSTPARIAAGQARWARAAMGEDGVVSTASIIDIPAPITGIRVEAAGGTVDVEVVQ